MLFVCQLQMFLQVLNLLVQSQSYIFVVKVLKGLVKSLRVAILLRMKSLLVEANAHLSQCFGEEVVF